MNLDHHLRHALERESPDAGFSGRVMNRVRAERTRRRTSHGPALLRSAAALILVAGIATGVHHRIEQRRQHELARIQIESALRITASKLDIARRGVLASTSGAHTEGSDR